MTHRGRSLRTDVLARVEGEGAMRIRARQGRVTAVELKIYEPPRFFEALLRGRRWTEPPDITARICGICPVAYQMSACLAIEDACEVRVDGPVGDLRRLLYCGEWIQSHTLHVYLLHAPDFLGYDGVVDMARDHREAVERGLRLKKAGNEVMAAIGGRAIHPVNVRVGGFWRAPAKPEMRRLRDPLLRAREDARATVQWVAGFTFPDFERHYELVAAMGAGYPLMGGPIVSSAGIHVAPAEFERTAPERQVAHSTALHARLEGERTYLVGPLARFGLSADRLSPGAWEAAADAGLEHPCRNPFRSIVVRAVETLHACEEALRIVESYEEPDRPAEEVPAREGTGYGVTEAPRGLLYHRYRLSADGTIEDARIVPPTSQNQGQIEEDLRALVEPRLAQSDAELTHLAEQAIRSYDPCISCATHFLDLSVERD